MKSRNHYGLPLLGIFFLVGLISYSSILKSFFLSDDFVLIGRVLEGDLSVTWGLGQGGFFRPLVILSYVVDSRLWVTNPFGYHLTNVALHTLNSYLVFILSARLMRRNRHDPAISFRISVAAGLIFLLLPSHTEAVSWISGRTDLIATLFFLLALIFYDSYQQERHIPYLAATLVLFTLAIFAKESAICLPLIIIAMELSPATNPGQAPDFKQAIKTGGLFVFIIFGLLLSPLCCHRHIYRWLWRKPSLEFQTFINLGATAKVFSKGGNASSPTAVIFHVPQALQVSRVRNLCRDFYRASLDASRLQT